MCDLKLSDSMGLEDKEFIKPMPQLHRSGINKRTEILAGYDYTTFNGISSLGETVFKEENMVPIGGCQYSFESLFGIKGPLNVPTLYETSGGTIGLPDV